MGAPNEWELMTSGYDDSRFSFHHHIDDLRMQHELEPWRFVHETLNFLEQQQGLTYRDQEFHAELVHYDLKFREDLTSIRSHVQDRGADSLYVRSVQDATRSYLADVGYRVYSLSTPLLPDLDYYTNPGRRSEPQEAPEPIQRKSYSFITPPPFDFDGPLVIDMVDYDEIPRGQGDQCVEQDYRVGYAHLENGNIALFIDHAGEYERLEMVPSEQVAVRFQLSGREHVTTVNELVKDSDFSKNASLLEAMYQLHKNMPEELNVEVCQTQENLGDISPSYAVTDVENDLKISR